MRVRLHNFAHGILIELIELGARGGNNTFCRNSSVAPEGLDGVRRVISWDFDIGVGARLVIGELNCHSLNGR